MCTPPVIQFTVQALSAYLRNTEVTNFFNVQVLVWRGRVQTDDDCLFYCTPSSVLSQTLGTEWCYFFGSSPPFTADRR